MSWEDNVRKVVPYVPGEQPKVADKIKLNTNENPYPPSPKVGNVLKNFDANSLRLYPDPEAFKLTEAIASYYGVDNNKVFVGVGSDDVLAMCFLTFFASSKPILFPDITYSFYDVWAKVFNIPYKTIPLDDDFKISCDDYMQDNGGVIFPNPNAPTGRDMSLSDIEKIVKNNSNQVVIVDEAYVDFGAQSALGLTDKYDNLLVVQTFSKSRSMAGARIGFAIGSKKLISYLNDVKYSFNSYTLSPLSIELGKAAIEDDEYFKKTCSKLIATRENSVDRLKELGFSCIDSKSNFIFAKHKTCSARYIFESLKKKNIFVRYFDKPRIDNYLRITVGTDEQMDIFIKTLKTIVETEK